MQPDDKHDLSKIDFTKCVLHELMNTKLKVDVINVKDDQLVEVLFDTACRGNSIAYRYMKNIEWQIGHEACGLLFDDFGKLQAICAEVDKFIIQELIPKNMVIEFAPSDLAEEYDTEIQEIFAALRRTDGESPRRGICASDESYISDIGPSEKALENVSKDLGITITKHMRFVDAAMELRNNRSKVKS